MDCKKKIGIYTFLFIERDVIDSKEGSQQLANLPQQRLLYVEEFVYNEQDTRLYHNVLIILSRECRKRCLTNPDIN